MQIEALIERLEGLTGPDETLDADVCVALQYGGLNSDGASNVRTDPDWEGDLLFEIEGDEHPECCNSIPALTSSLDAAIALVEKVLPGWGWDVASGTEHIKACLNPEYGEPIGKHPHWAAVANTSSKQFHDGATPAIALLIAMFRALAAGGLNESR